MKKPNLIDSIQTDLNIGGMFPDTQKQAAADNYWLTQQKSHGDQLDKTTYYPEPPQKKGLLESITAPIGNLMETLFSPNQIKSPIPEQKPQVPQVLAAEAPTNTPTPTATPTPPPDQRAMPYYQTINEAAQKFDVPQDILYALIKAESNFNPEARGPVLKDGTQALGIAQFLNTTAKGMGFDPLDWKEAIMQAAKYLRSKYEMHGNSWENALAAYNAGSGAVNQYKGVPPYPETQNYIKKILGK